VLVARCAVLVGGGVLEVPSVGTDNGTQRYQALVLSKPSKRSLHVVPKNPAKGTRTTKIQTTVYEPARLKWERACPCPGLAVILQSRSRVSI
jgi:hypothetical protein